MSMSYSFILQLFFVLILNFNFSLKIPEFSNNYFCRPAWTLREWQDMFLCLRHGLGWEHEERGSDFFSFFLRNPVCSMAPEKSPTLPLSLRSLNSLKIEVAVLIDKLYMYSRYSSIHFFNSFSSRGCRLVPIFRLNRSKNVIVAHLTKYATSPWCGNTDTAVLYISKQYWVTPIYLFTFYVSILLLLVSLLSPRYCNVPLFGLYCFFYLYNCFFVFCYLLDWT